MNTNMRICENRDLAFISYRVDLMDPNFVAEVKVRNRKRGRKRKEGGKRFTHNVTFGETGL